MLYNSVSVDMKVYALQLNQKSTGMEFCEILQQLLSRIILGAASEKKTVEEKGEQ